MKCCLQYSPDYYIIIVYESIPIQRKRLSILFLSNEEDRTHVHVTSEQGEAKFWLEPIVSLAVYHGLNSRKLTEIQKIVEARKDEIIKHWKKHFCKR